MLRRYSRVSFFFCIGNVAASVPPICKRNVWDPPHSSEKCKEFIYDECPQVQCYLFKCIASGYQSAYEVHGNILDRRVQNRVRNTTSVIFDALSSTFCFEPWLSTSTPSMATEAPVLTKPASICHHLPPLTLFKSQVTTQLTNSCLFHNPASWTIGNNPNLCGWNIDVENTNVGHLNVGLRLWGFA